MIMERNNKKITIAIDGFSSSGKSTMAKVLARNIGYAYIDSGAMYRAITLFCIENALIDDSGNVNETELERRIGNVSISFEVNPSSGASEVCLDGRNVEGKIRGMRVSNLVSKVAALPFVRRAMVAQQQQMGGNGIMGMSNEYDENPFDPYGDEMTDSVTYNSDEDSENNEAEKAEFENTLLKAFDNFLKQEENDTI